MSESDPQALLRRQQQERAQRNGGIAAFGTFLAVSIGLGYAISLLIDFQRTPWIIGISCGAAAARFVFFRFVPRLGDGLDDSALKSLNDTDY